MQSDISTREVLAQGLRQLKLDLPATTQDRMLAYVDLLAKWNRTYNLTAVRDPVQMVIRHLLDSLTVLPYIRGSRFIDVGTGAGLPGIPLALVLTDAEWVLLDSNGKKTRFVVQAVAESGLDNVVVANTRAEDYHPADLFDVVITRAFAALDVIVRDVAHLCRPGGRILAMKGKLSSQEVKCMAGIPATTTIHSLGVPGLQEERHLVEVFL